MKVKTCSQCGNDCFYWSAKLKACKDCSQRIKAKEAIISPVKPRKPLVQYNTTIIKKKPVKVAKDEYKDFFESLEIEPRCQECNQLLLAFNNFGKRCCSAHILPKSTFKSVAKLPENILYLGAGFLGSCSCHDKWDSCIENRISMRVYKIAVDRFNSFSHMLTDKEIVMAEKYLGI